MRTSWARLPHPGGRAHESFRGAPDIGHDAPTTTLLLVHGGLWEPGMDAGAFWRRPGVVGALSRPACHCGSGLVPAEPENLFHQHRTVDALAALVPGAMVLPGCTEPPRPDFGSGLERFADVLAAFAR
jgi:hypothetical protein